MHVLVAYSRPRGKYGRYVFTVMIHFAEETETAEIAVMRLEQQTKTAVKYSCDHCGRWASITTHETVTVNTPLKAREHQKDGKLELYRYDNVDPDDWMELILRDSQMWAYQSTYIPIGKSNVSLKNRWGYTNDRIGRSGTEMKDEILYDINLLEWDEYIQTRPTDLGGMSVEEELIRQTMNAEEITINELMLEPTSQPLEIEGEKHFIEGKLQYLP